MKEQNNGKNGKEDANHQDRVANDEEAMQNSSLQEGDVERAIRDADQAVMDSRRAVEEIQRRLPMTLLNLTSGSFPFPSMGDLFGGQNAEAPQPQNLVDILGAALDTIDVSNFTDIADLDNGNNLDGSTVGMSDSSFLSDLDDNMSVGSETSSKKEQRKRLN